MAQFDYIIVGGGIVGCSIAYHLTTGKARSVAVFERNELASAASSLAAGLVLQVTSKPANTPLVQVSRATIRDLEATLGDTVGFHAVGSLRVVASQAGCAMLKALAEDSAHCNIPYQFLGPDQARSRVPWLKLPEAGETLFMPTDGYVDPYLLSMAYARAARMSGAVFRPHSNVSNVIIKGGRVIGVEVDGERVFAKTVIDAAGVWAALLSEKAGYALPMAPVRSHYWICEPDDIYGADHPVTMLADAAAYVRPEIGGLVVGVQEQTSKTFDARDLPDDLAAFSPTQGEAHWDILARGAEAVESFFPAIMQARFSDYVAGLSSYTPDGLMLMGPVPGVSGFLAAAGCCGNGIALSGGIGAAISALATGEAPPFDISAFDPARFGKVNPHSPAFRSRCAAAQASKSRRVV